MLSKSSYDSTGHAYFIFGYFKDTSKTRKGFFLLFLNQIWNLSEVPNIGVRAGGGGGEGGSPPKKFWATRIFWVTRENLGKARF